MPKYLIDVDVTVHLKDVPVSTDDDDFSIYNLEEEVQKVVNDRLVMLDIKGGLSGSDGVVVQLEIDKPKWTRV